MSPPADSKYKGEPRPADNTMTLVARLTAPGTAALATIGIVGPDSVRIAEQLFQGKASGRLANASTSGHSYGDFGAEFKDDVVLNVVSHLPPVEVHIHCHGGSAIVRQLVDAIVASGARAAPWTEYLLATGKSLIELEATEALSQCTTARCSAILLDQLAGALEAAFDRIETARDQGAVDDLLRWAEFGLHLVNPWRVALVGPANAGKSSLLNALAGFQRAIVAPEPGTTRDVLSAQVSFSGWPVELLDGAGFRDQPSPLEARGQQLLRSQLEKVDLCILVADTSAPFAETLCRLESELQPDIMVGTKCDLQTHWSAEQLAGLRWRCSALTGEGMDGLIQLIANRLVPEVPVPGQAITFTSRQIDWVRRLSDR